MLKTLTALIGLSLIATATVAAASDVPVKASDFAKFPNSTLVSFGTTPTGYAWANEQRVPCYSTLRIETDTKGKAASVTRERECIKPAESVSDIGMPAFGPPINMKDPKTGQTIKEATHFRVEKNGTITLY